MDFITSPYATQRPWLKRGSARYGKSDDKSDENSDENSGEGPQALESILSVRSKQKEFLGLLAEQREKNSLLRFHDADLSHVDLRQVDLTDVDLTGANLTNANLSGAKLVRTNLSNTTLVRTILLNANISDVVLTNAVIDRVTQLALQQISHQQWHELAQNTITSFSQKWEKLKSVDGFNAFESVLKRISARNFKSNVTDSEVLEIIEAVIKSPEICQLVFQAAQGTDVNCPAHLLTVWNTTQGLTKFAKLYTDNAGQQEMLSLAKGMVKQNLLDEVTLPVMRNQWSEGRRNCNQNDTGPNVSEALKVQLALRHQLAKALKLPFPVKNPSGVIDIAELDNSDKKFVIDFVNSYMSDKEQLVDALIALPMWQLYLNRTLSDLITEKEVSPNTVNLLLRQETERMLYCAADDR